MKTLFYIPKDGVLIRNHDGRGHIPAEGAVRIQNQYYDRRVKDGDLFIREEGAGTPAQPPAEVEGKNSRKKGDNA